MLILRPVGWPMQSTCGFSIAVTRRSVSRSRGAVEAGVDRGHHPVARRQRLVVEVEAPVRPDVDLDALENGDPRDAASISRRSPPSAPRAARPADAWRGRRWRCSEWPRSLAASTISSRVARPSDQSVCMCRSPLRSASSHQRRQLPAHAPRRALLGSRAAPAGSRRSRDARRRRPRRSAWTFSPLSTVDDPVLADREAALRRPPHAGRRCGPSSPVKCWSRFP